MKLYLYCVVESVDALKHSLNGISGTPVRLLNMSGLSLLVSEFGGDTVPVTSDNALTHAAVVRSVLDQTTPLPFRFGTVVTEQRVEEYVTTRREALQAKLEQVRGAVEMSVKILRHDDRKEESPPEDHTQDKPGTAFLAEKRRELLASEARVAEATKIASWLQDRVMDLTRDTRVRTNPTDKLLLAAAHLVGRDSVDQYRSRLKEARLERPELHFLVSGPWAPYSFANIDLEVNTRFGVS